MKGIKEFSASFDADIIRKKKTIGCIVEGEFNLLFLGESLLKRQGWTGSQRTIYWIERYNVLVTVCWVSLCSSFWQEEIIAHCDLRYLGINASIMAKCCSSDWPLQESSGSGIFFHVETVECIRSLLSRLGLAPTVHVFQRLHVLPARWSFHLLEMPKLF